jgi:hypothetical protein
MVGSLPRMDFWIQRSVSCSVRLWTPLCSARRLGRPDGPCWIHAAAENKGPCKQRGEDPCWSPSYSTSTLSVSNWIQSSSKLLVAVPLTGERLVGVRCSTPRSWGRYGRGWVWFLRPGRVFTLTLVLVTLASLCLEACRRYFTWIMIQRFAALFFFFFLRAWSMRILHFIKCHTTWNHIYFQWMW